MWQSDLTPIDFESRRKAFLKGLKKSIAVFPSAPRALRNFDVYHPYRQDTNLYYLSGFEEPNALCLLSTESKTPFQMFVEPRDPERERWEGRCMGPEEVKSKCGADAVHSSIDGSFDEAFIAALVEADKLYYRVGVQPELDQKIFELMRKTVRRIGRTGRSLWPIHDPSEILSEMRVFKNKAEIERLQQAAHISADAHVNAMRIAKPGLYEYEVEAVLYHAFRVHGAARVGYSSIVASGPNACVLHYHKNQRRMENGELLLVDAGAEYDYYTADVTRTFPVGGMFSDAQREIYSAVLRAQKEVIRHARPGKTLPDLHLIALEVLVEELRRLKILKGQTKSILKNRAYRPFYPHGTSHWLGMEVHDAGRYYEGDYTQHRRLEAGNVFTVEPGLYFPPDSSAPAKYKGIGVRIEDDVLVTAKEVHVLSSGVPKEIDEVESLCSQT